MLYYCDFYRQNSDAIMYTYHTAHSSKCASELCRKTQWEIYEHWTRSFKFQTKNPSRPCTWKMKSSKAAAWQPFAIRTHLCIHIHRLGTYLGIKSFIKRIFMCLKTLAQLWKNVLRRRNNKKRIPKISAYSGSSMHENERQVVASGGRDQILVSLWELLCMC